MKSSEVKTVPLNVVSRVEFAKIEANYQAARAACSQIKYDQPTLAARLTAQKKADALRTIRDSARELLFSSVIDVEEGFTWGRPAPKTEV